MDFKLFKLPVIFSLIGLAYLWLFEGEMASLMPYTEPETVEVYLLIEKFVFVKSLAICLLFMLKNHRDQLKYLQQKRHELIEQLSENIITQTRHNEESRRMSEVLNMISNLVLIINKDKEITWINQAYLDFTEYTREELMGRKQLELLSGPKTNSNTMVSLYNAMLKNKSFSGEIIYYKKYGEEYWAQQNITPILDKNGEIEFYISVETVITERKKKEEKIKEQNRALRQIAWFNSHEIRRPVASILSLLELLKQTESREERLEYLSLLELCSAELDNAIINIAGKINHVEGQDNGV